MIREQFTKVINKFNDLKLKIKLALAFGIIIILFLIPITVSFEYFNQTVQIFNRTNEITIPEIYLATSVSNDMKHIEKNLYALILTDNITKKDEYKELNSTLSTQIKSNLDELKGLLSTDKDKVDKIIGVLDKEEDIRQQIVDSKYKSDAQRLIFNSYDPIVNEINSTLEEITNGINQRVNQRAKISDNNSRTAMAVTIVMTIVAILLVIFITIIISRSIVIPVDEIDKLAHALLDGNLSYKMNYKSNNELGRLANSLQHSINTLVTYINQIDYVMGEVSKGNFNVNIKQKFVGDFERIEHSITNSVNMLSDTLMKIDVSSEKVSLGAEQIASGAQSLSDGASEQASSIEKLSEDIKEISDKIIENLSIAAGACDSAMKLSDEIDGSSENMKKMIAAMTEINNKSKRIDKIIKTIEDIAFQTNILALNAAVEAARAGSYGKGFSVVAEEVRNLANKSAEASKSTKLLIDDTIKSVTAGNLILDETAKSLSGVVSSSVSIGNTINEITKYSQQQAKSIDSITSGIEQISCVVHDNSAASEESAAISEDLSGQAKELRDLVGGFTFS